MVSESEIWILLSSIATAAATWLFWGYRLLSCRRPRTGVSGGALLLLPAICPVLCLLLLRRYADALVRVDFGYQLMYAALGAAWVGVLVHATGYLGISMRDDVAERGNAAAVWVFRGLIPGMWLAYTGGNFGDGPGWWVVVFCGVLTTGLLWLLWSVVEGLTSVSERITVDRDVVAGIRLGALLLAAGLMLGRGAAGDWVSAWSAMKDIFIAALPVAGLGALEVVLGMVSPAGTGSEPGARLRNWGLLPATGYLAGAVVWLLARGPWE